VIKLKLTKRQLIALAIAVLFIIFGLVQAVTGLQINKKVMDEVSFVLLMGAAVILFGGRKKKVNESDATKQVEEVKEPDLTEKQGESEEK
jgi:hypothetical protein